LERKLDFEAGESEEVAVVGAECGAVLDGERCQVGVHDQRRSGQFESTRRRHECRRGTLKRAPQIQRNVAQALVLAAFTLV
jgi:hypothetical protein